MIKTPKRSLSDELRVSSLLTLVKLKKKRKIKERMIKTPKRSLSDELRVSSLLTLVELKKRKIKERVCVCV